MSVALLSSALHALVGCRLSPSRDGILIVSPGGSSYDLVTVRSDEGELLAAVDALAAALRARGGKVTQVQKVDAPSWEAPKVEPIKVATTRRGKAAK